MLRRFVAGALLGVSLLVGSFAWSGFVALRTVFEPDRSREIAEELLDNDEVRSQVASNMADAISGSVLQNAPVDLVDAATVEAVANEVLNDPAVEELIVSSFAQTHAAFLGEGDAPQNIDLSAFGETARRSLVEAVPSLDSALPASPPLNVALPTERIPDASPIRSFLQKVVPILAIGAAAGALIALFATTDRPSILRRAGYWALSTTAFYLVLGLGVPWLLRRFAPDGWEVLAAFLAAVLRATLVPAIVLGIAGVALLGASAVWRTATAASGRDRRPSRRSEAAPVEPARPQRQPRRPQGQAAPAPTARPSAPAQAAPRRPPQPTDPTRVQAQVRPAQRPPRSSPPAASPRVPEAPAPADSVFSDVPKPREEPPRPQQSQRPAAPASTNASVPAAAPDVEFAPSWVEGHGWVLNPNDPRPLPASAVWVDGVGHVVPGPPPAAR